MRTGSPRGPPIFHPFRDKHFGIGFGGELVKAGFWGAMFNEIGVFPPLGMHFWLVHGSRPQVEEQLALRHVQTQFVDGIRVTDNAALESAKEASGELRLDIEATFSQALPNTPMAGARISVVSGNFVTARPVGIVNGVDFQHTGLVRKIDAESIQHSLSNRKIVLLSPLGFSPTGQAFNLSMEDVATNTATALKADKLIFITEVPGIMDRVGKLQQELSMESAIERLREGRLSSDTAYYLQHIVKAMRGGVRRAHLIPFALDGSILLELFLHDGVGTMVSHTDLEYLREATLDDVGGIVQLIEPLEADGTLVPRERRLLERDIANFSVIEHDGIIFGCAALYPYPKEGVGEMACLTVAPDTQGTGDGERLLKHVEARARAVGLKRLFVLTTRTEHWFLKRGFVHATVDDLPEDRRKLYNWQRRSMVLMKKL
ncbi:Amino-acid acetyltransferase [Ralstonia solanacearum UW551]|uniref:Amino-acid acetyltransferase n=1 Tax=Ralstonia solanacearum (strain UW551) TaxID=342110 RepID=A0AB33VEM4_RALSU|nr:Amino-acid acetyltransferase [Ralstonia solanacearum UW551]